MFNFHVFLSSPFTSSHYARFRNFETYVLTKSSLPLCRKTSRLINRDVFRTSELVALIAVSTTLFLFLHTRDLHLRLKEMEVRLQPEDIILTNQLLSGKCFHTINPLTGNWTKFTSRREWTRRTIRRQSHDEITPKHWRGKHKTLSKLVFYKTFSMLEDVNFRTEPTEQHKKSPTRCGVLQ